MALKARNEQHQQQINAGTLGRRKGHKFEEILTQEINLLQFTDIIPSKNETHLYRGNPAWQLLQYIANNKQIHISDAKAWWLGGLATSGNGDNLHDEYHKPITKCKSDIVIEISTNYGKQRIGTSVKTCANKTPTNDQMFFTTARAFCALLENNGIHVPIEAVDGLAQFCGDMGFRPLDNMTEEQLVTRISDPNRYYWEELSLKAKECWEDIFAKHQDDITRLLFQKAYKNDAYPPDYLLHQTVSYEKFNDCPTAIFSIDEIVALSRLHCGFVLSEYIIRKGTYKADFTTHYAPRFGFIQFQRGGQKQHPTQLQFNLKAGYFNRLP